MKKILLTIITVILLTINVSAQFKPFQFGLKIEPGLNWAKLNSEDLHDNKTKISFNWGFIGNFYFVENYGVETGFTVRSVKGEYSFLNKSEKIFRKINNQYLEIPITLKMRTDKMGKFRIFGNIGYGLGIKLNTTEKYLKKDNNWNTKDDYRDLRHALIVKLGVEYYVYKSSCITAALVFNDNFINIFKNNNYFDQNIKLNNSCIEIGFFF